ncbi:hypothetical protein K6T82_21930 [Flavobacterium sp. 17A]|uniref:Uncharacterized protein n=1 Tax=Flavobacterium potami TaxID=2872310 RepID=A0A9X1HE20_9FLAO|nr:hypothetical protein [Flavobacterium potami]MBZ4037436.1 hypothetical protein [Flavobacterium potami]
MENPSKSKSFKRHSSSIITVLFIALLVLVYLSYILPKNKAREDEKNVAILKGIEKQLLVYIDDQVKYISDNKFRTLDISKFKGADDIYIDNIKIDRYGFQSVKNGKIELSRTITISSSIKDRFKGFKKKDTVFPDVISIDLVKFLNKINSTTLFTSFYICPVESGKCRVDKSFISENISLSDQDSLVDNSRRSGPITFKKSSKRFYTNQIVIPQTDHNIFLAVGIDNSYFETNARQIDSPILILSLVSVIILILGINFIKPIISSQNERLSQLDLVGVVFSIGVLSAVLTVFALLALWNKTLKENNTKDLKILVNRIDSCFSKQINNTKKLRYTSAFEIELKKTEHKYAKIYFIKGSDSISLDGNSDSKSDGLLRNQKFAISKSYFDENSKELQNIDVFFRMDNKGLITKYLSATNPELRRKFDDRMYFKVLQPQNKYYPNINRKIKTYLTAVFSREQNKYQWIYADIDSLGMKNVDPDSIGIKGTAFREYFSKNIKLPPRTSYMIVDRSGDVLMHEDSKNSLFQNVLNDSPNNFELISTLSGVIPKTFEMVLQGKAYQVCAEKLDVAIDSPIYILGIRDLTHINRLSIYTFTNGFLISIFFGFFLLLLNYMYSIILYSSQISIFSNRHFWYLFPNKSRTSDYKKLFMVNCVSILLALLVSLNSSPSVAFVFCVLLGYNLAFLNVISLNTRILDFKYAVKSIIVFLILGISIPFLVFSFSTLWFAVFILFCMHLILIFYYKNFKTKKGENTEDESNKSVSRTSFISFLTARLVFQYTIFPLILISSLYVSEINEFARFYNTSIKETNDKRANNIQAYQSGFHTLKIPFFKVEGKDSVMQEADFDFLNRPALYEINNFTFFSALKDEYFLSSHAILQKENIRSIVMIFIFLFVFLPVISYQLINYYSNRFFFYDLMQVSWKEIFLSQKKILKKEDIYIQIMNISDIKSLIQDYRKKLALENNILPLEDQSDRDITINKFFKTDTNNEIPELVKRNFMINYYKRNFYEIYNEIWNSLPHETQYVLYDFAQDYFVNYKNKDTVISFMECGIIDIDKTTGRLKMMSASFRFFVLSHGKSKSFIEEFKNESKDGTYNRFKFPLFIIAISALLLLMYLNKDSYDQVAAMGGSIVTIIALITKFMDANKSM